MCMGMYSSPPWGIPIPEEVHEQYSSDLKAAWITFDAWWKEAQENSDGDPVPRSSMPDNVRQAMDLILATPIPGYEGEATGADSCYMIGVTSMMTD